MATPPPTVGTTLIYNGIALRDCETKVFEQKVQYDPSGTDVIYSRFKIRVSSTLVSYEYAQNREHLSTIRPDEVPTVGGSVPERIRRVHTMLSEKGQLFYFYIPNATSNGAHLEPGWKNRTEDLMLIAIGNNRPDSGVPPLLVPIHPDLPDGDKINAKDIADTENGPKPTHVSVDQIFGSRAMRVTFEIVVCRQLCDQFLFDEEGELTDETDPYPLTEPNIDAVPDNPETPNVDESEAGRKITPTTQILSNRWYVTESKDANWVTTRVLQGTLRVTDKSVLPHMMRYLVMPPLLRGYQRVSQTFANDPTDLVLKYRIEDRERHQAPPDPAINWSGHFVETGSKHGVYQTAEMQLRLIGPPGVDKQDLIGAAGRVINARMNGLHKDPANPTTDHKVQLLNAAVVEVIGEPVIEFRIQVRYAGADKNYLTLRLKRIGEPLNKSGEDPPNSIDGYYPDQWPSPLPYDSETPSGILSCYLQRPCSRWHGIVSWEEDKVKPYEGYDENDKVLRPGYHSRSEHKLDRDVRNLTNTSNLPFPREDKDIVSIDQFAGFPYTHIAIRSEYKTDTGRVQLPYAKSDPSASEPTAALIKLHSGACKRIFRMEASRTGALPKVPEPAEEITDVNGISEAMESWSISADAPKIGADWVSREYRIFCEYVYLLSRPPNASEKLRMAISPIDATPGEDRLIDASELFTNQLIEWPPPT